MRVLVTGHTGFIGSNLIHFLDAQGVETQGFSRSVGKDILNPTQMSQAVSQCDLVIHAAGYADPAGSMDNPREALQANLFGTENVLQACREAGIPCVFIGSCEIYGDSEEPLSESAPLAPPSPYALSKAAADLLCFTYNKCYGVDVRSVRLFNPYGPNQQRNKIVPTFYRQAQKGEPVTIYGDGSDSRDYVYIDDIVSGIWMAREVPAGMCVNLANAKSVTSLEIAELILRLSKSDSPVTFTPYPPLFAGIFHQVGLPDTMTRLTGWEAKVSLEDGVGRTLAWLDTL